MSAGEPARSAVDGQPLTIVSVEDLPDDIDLIRLALEEGGLAAEVFAADDAASFQRQLERQPDLVLCDFNLPRFSPQAALSLIEARGLHVPLIVVTRAIGESAAVDVLRRGARDYVAKNRLATLPQVIRRVLADARTARLAQRTHEELLAAHARLREMSNHLIDVQERERHHVARELHDVLGQLLTSVLMHLDAAERSGDAEAAASYRSTAMQLAREALDQVRTLSFTLRPAQLDLLGLESALRSAAELQLRPLGISPRVRVRGAVDSASPTQVAVLHRVVLEALTNIVRHAHASSVSIAVALRQDGRLTASVADDGVGFGVQAVLNERHSPQHLGLTGMLERSELVGGRLTIRSRPGRGTLVHVSL